MKLVITPWKQQVGVFGFEDNTLVEANIYDLEQQICIGDIYLGRVNKILPNMNACFVQIGGEEEVFLPFSEMVEMPKSGDHILVQIKKEASKGKQALGTTHLSIAGLYCVLNYEPHSIEISSKLEAKQRDFWKKKLKEIIASDKIKSEDKEIILKYCLIVRTNVTEAANVYEVVSEWCLLARKLDFIISKGKYQSLYTKLHSENQRFLNYIKNVPQNELEEVITDDIHIYNEIKNTFEGIHELQSKVRLYQDDFALSKLYSLDSKLNEAINKKVWLKCGGFLVIEPTEALTVIDVNSGKFDKKSDSEMYYKKVNLEAAVEIAKQLKLRNISGIIIIDFINMSSSINNTELLDILSSLVSKDKIKTHVIGMTSLGLVEMTRAKREKPLWEQMKIM